MTEKHEIDLGFTNDETDEIYGMTLTVTTWYYPGSMEEPAESGYEWSTRYKYPEWITDSMIDDAVEDAIYHGFVDGCED